MKEGGQDNRAVVPKCENRFTYNRGMEKVYSDNIRVEDNFTSKIRKLELKMILDEHCCLNRILKLPFLSNVKFVFSPQSRPMR